jgi:hypothetical protein
VLAGGAVTTARRRASVIASTLTLRYTPPPSHVLSEAEGTVTLKPVLSEVEGLSKRWLPALLGAYDHTPVSPLVKAVFVALMRVTPLISTLMAEPLARKPSMYDHARQTKGAV